MRGSHVLFSSGKSWATRQASDTFVSQARREGYVARSAYKLQHIDSAFGLFSPSYTRAVVDLGAAPGGWTQVIREKCHPQCLIVAVDLLSPRLQVPGAVYIRGDFTSPETQFALRNAVQISAKPFADREDDADDDERPPSSGAASSSGGILDVVTSDMCPNRTGGSEDMHRIAALQLQALQYALKELKLHGHFVCKVLGSTTAFEELHNLARRHFTQVKICKPPASRTESAESFLVCIRKLEAAREMQRRLPERGSVEPKARLGDFGLDDWPGMVRRGEGHHRSSRRN